MEDTYDDDRREREYSRSPRRDRDRSASPNGRAGDSHAPPEYGRRSPVEERNAGTNLFVTGLIPTLRDEELRELFSQHGEVENASIVRDPHSRDSRGFGFVNMMTPEDADAVIEKLQGYDLHGRSINVEKAKRNRPRTPTPGRYQGPPKRDMRRGFGDRRGPPPRRDDYRSYPRDGDRYTSDRYGGDRYGSDRRGDRGGDRGGDRRYRDRSDGYGGRGDGYGSRRDDRDRYGGGGAPGGGGRGGGYGYGEGDGYSAAPPAARAYDDRDRR